MHRGFSPGTDYLICRTRVVGEPIHIIESITTWCSTKTRPSSQSCPLAICDCRYRWYGSALRLANGVSLIGKFDGEFATHSSTYAGTGTVRYTW
jgi:hypothetical protein